MPSPEEVYDCVRACLPMGVTLVSAVDTGATGNYVFKLAATLWPDVYYQFIVSKLQLAETDDWRAFLRLSANAAIGIYGRSADHETQE